MKTAREIIAPEKAQHVEAVLRLFNWLVPRLRQDADKETCLHLVTAHLDAAHDEGLRDAWSVLDAMADAAIGRDHRVLSVAANAISKLRELNNQEPLTLSRSTREGKTE